MFYLRGVIKKLVEFVHNFFSSYRTSLKFMHALYPYDLNKYRKFHDKWQKNMVAMATAATNITVPRSTPLFVFILAVKAITFRDIYDQLLYNYIQRLRRTRCGLVVKFLTPFPSSNFSVSTFWNPLLTLWWMCSWEGLFLAGKPPRFRWEICCNFIIAKQIFIILSACTPAYKALSWLL